MSKLHASDCRVIALRAYHVRSIGHILIDLAFQSHTQGPASSVRLPSDATVVLSDRQTDGQDGISLSCCVRHPCREKVNLTQRGVAGYISSDIRDCRDITHRSHRPHSTDMTRRKAQSVKI